MRLWEVDHSYYCNQGNYYSNECGAHFRSWSEFLAEFGESDPDYNLLFRWDWRGADGKYDPTAHSDNYRDGKLCIFWMGQRKGLYFFSTVEVCKLDEPAIREWLTGRWKHLAKLWEPIADVRSDDVERREEGK